LTCLSTSTSNDKLAFDVGLQHDSQGITSNKIKIVKCKFVINKFFLIKVSLAGGQYTRLQSKDQKARKLELEMTLF
jgi:hypothetical protein